MLETERLILRPPRESDTGAVCRQLSNFGIAKWLARVPHPYPENGGAGWWARVLEREREGQPPYYMMTLRDGDDDPVGALVLTRLEGDVYRLGYWLDEPQWGKGLMSEAVAAVMEDCFTRLGAAAMVAGIFEGNAGSERILRKSGFVDVDVTREWCEARGKTLNHINLRRDRDVAAAGKE